MYIKIKYRSKEKYLVYGVRTSKGSFSTGADFLIYNGDKWEWVNDTFVTPADETDIL